MALTVVVGAAQCIGAQRGLAVLLCQLFGVLQERLRLAYITSAGRCNSKVKQRFGANQRIVLALGNGERFRRVGFATGDFAHRRN